MGQLGDFGVCLRVFLRLCIATLVCWPVALSKMGRRPQTLIHLEAKGAMRCFVLPVGAHYVFMFRTKDISRLY